MADTDDDDGDDDDDDDDDGNMNHLCFRGSQMTDEKLAHTLMDQYVAAGGNFIDTAEM